MVSTVVNQQMNNKTKSNSNSNKTKSKNKTILNNNATQKKVKTNKQNITNKNDNIAVPRVSPSSPLRASPPRVSPLRASPPRVSPHLLKKQVHKARTIGGFDLTPLISAILLAGIKLSIMQNKQNKNVVEKRKSAKSTKSRTSTKTK
jgi:hypothetical protein